MKFERAVGSRWAVPVVLAVAFLLYLPSAANTFAMDDEPIARSKCVQYPELRGDPVITGYLDATKWDYFAKFFTRHYWWPESHNDGLYRPIAVLSYGLVYQAAGRFLPEEREALPQHLVNVLLHGWAVWLSIGLLLAVGASRVVAVLTGLLFAVHAVHSEVVAGIVGRAEIFSFCFGAQAMILLLRATAVGGRWRYGLAGFLALLAYGSKESSLCWIPFYFCLEVVRGLGAGGSGHWSAPLRRRQTWFAGLALVLPALCWFGMRALALQSEPLLEEAADFSSNPLVYESAAARILTGIRVWGYGLWLCFVPAKLSCIYSPHVFAIVRSPLDPGFLAGLAALAALAVAGFRFARRQPLLFFAMTCFLGFSFVTSNVPLAIGTIFGERLYYTPSLGVCLLLALLLPALRGRAAAAYLAILALWCAGNAVQTSIRVADWHSSRTVFLADVAKYPQAIDLHRKVAQTHMDPGPHRDLDKAIEHFEIAISLQPDYAHAFRGLGRIYQERKEWDKAIAAYGKSYGRGYPDPEGAESIAFNAIGDCHLGMAAESSDPAEIRRQVATAIGWFQRTLKAPLWGDSWGEANNRIGDSHVRLSALEKAPDDIARVRRQALQYYFRTIGLRPIDKLSRRVAFERVFEHAFTPDPLLPGETIRTLYEGALQVAGEDPELALLMGAAAYKANLPTIMVLRPLHAAIELYPPDKRDANFYKAHVFYGEALLEIGEVAQARRVYEMLLGRPEIDAALKEQIGTQLRQDPRFRR